MSCDNPGVRKDASVLVGEILHIKIDIESKILIKLDQKSCEHFPKGINLLLSSNRFRSKTVSSNEIVIRVLKTWAENRLIYAACINDEHIDKARRNLQVFRYIHFIPNDSSKYRYIKKVHQFHSIKTTYKWNILNSVSPFVVFPTDCAATSANVAQVLNVCPTRRNITNSEFMEMQSVLNSANIVLSHSSDISKREILCTARIFAFEMLDSRVIVKLHTEQVVDIWDDLHIFIFPAEFFKEKFAETETTTSVMGIRERIGAWKYVGGKFRRYQKKIGYMWKNIYYTMLKFKPFFDDHAYIIEKIEKGSKFLLSSCREIPGQIHIEVVDIDRDETGIDQTISVIVTGFCNSKVDLKLSRSTPYYLQPDCLEDDRQSLKTESQILEGYTFENDPDELCEQIGDLKYVQSTVKRWITDPVDVFCCRVGLTSQNRKTKMLRSLEGRYVRLSSLDWDGEAIAVIIRAISGMVLIDIKSLCPSVERFPISLNNTYRIRIDHEFERAIGEKCCADERIAEFYDLRDCLQESGNDLKYLKTSRPNGGKHMFAYFLSNNDNYDRIPDGTVVLLGKCWEIERLMNNKSEFVFARKCNEGCERKNARKNIVCFEIKYTKSLLESSNFNLTNAYYFVEFIDFTMFDIFDRLKPIYVKLSSQPSKRIENYYIETAKWKRNEKTTGRIEKEEEEEEKEEVEVKLDDDWIVDGRENSDNQEEEEDEFCENEEIEYRRIDPTIHQEIGLVCICDYESFEDEDCPRLYLCLNIEKHDEMGICENEGDPAAKLFYIGRRLLITLDHSSDLVRIEGVVTAINGFNVTLLVSNESSSIKFVKYWIKFMLIFKLQNMMMLCYGENE